MRGVRSHKIHMYQPRTLWKSECLIVPLIICCFLSNISGRRTDDQQVTVHWSSDKVKIISSIAVSNFGYTTVRGFNSTLSSLKPTGTFCGACLTRCHTASLILISGTDWMVSLQGLWSNHGASRDSKGEKSYRAVKPCFGEWVCTCCLPVGWLREPSQYRYMLDLSKDRLIIIVLSSKKTNKNHSCWRSSCVVGKSHATRTAGAGS